MSDEYVRISCTVEAIRNKAVMLSVGESVRRAAWIPRSAIHGADDLTLDGMMAGTKTVLRIREWKADQEGLTSQHQDAGADRDMFPEGQ